MPFLPLHELPKLFPHVEAWIRSLEQTAIDNGESLPLSAKTYAQAAGVVHPEKIRILSVPRIPRPDHTRVAELVESIDLLTDSTRGLTAGYGIVLRTGCRWDLKLIVHEFVHVAQYERFGVALFLRLYIRQLATNGYKMAGFEIEAEMKTSEILS